MNEKLEPGSRMKGRLLARNSQREQNGYYLENGMFLKPPVVMDEISQIYFSQTPKIQVQKNDIKNGPATDIHKSESIQPGAKGVQANLASDKGFYSGQSKSDFFLCVYKDLSTVPGRNPYFSKVEMWH